MIFDATQIEIDFNNHDTFCICCNLPYPTRKSYFPLCISNMMLGDLGPGFPLLFQFIKYNAILLTILTIIYFLPAMGLIGAAFTKLGPLGGRDNSLSLMSIGVFLRSVDLLQKKFTLDDWEEDVDLRNIPPLCDSILPENPNAINGDGQD